jgi:hypothetical protein
MGSISVKITSEYPPADFFICFSLHIVSQAIKELIQSFENVKVEFFPMEVFVSGEKYVHKNYFFMHIIDEVNCFDSIKSEYKSHQVKSTGATIIDSIHKLVLKPVNTKEHRLFRVSEVGFFILCVDAVIASQIADAGLTGVVFLEPSETF